jgi:hypothetical protein
VAQGRKTGGRKAGVPNKRTAAKNAALQAVVAKFEEAVPTAFEGDAVALMQLIYRDPALPIELRLDAAKSSARFERPALGAIMTKDVTPAPETPQTSDVSQRINELLGKARGEIAIGEPV